MAVEIYRIHTIEVMHPSEMLASGVSTKGGSGYSLNSKHGTANCTFRWPCQENPKTSCGPLRRENVISGISTTGNVIYCSFEFDPQRSCHGLNILYNLHLCILDKCVIRHFYKHTPRVKKSVPAPENGEYKLLNCPTVNYLVKIKFKIQDLTLGF